MPSKAQQLAQSLSANTYIVDMSNSTGALNIPQGTTAKRPSAAANGAIRYNTSNNVTEIYSGLNWTTITSQTYTANYLIVAGGGGAGSGGGGAGGFLTGTATLTGGTSYDVTIGAGGAGVNGNGGVSGSNTVVNNLYTAVGGGFGGITTCSSSSVFRKISDSRYCWILALFLARGSTSALTILKVKPYIGSFLLGACAQNLTGLIIGRNLLRNEICDAKSSIVLILSILDLTRTPFSMTDLNTGDLILLSGYDVSTFNFIYGSFGP